MGACDRKWNDICRLYYLWNRKLQNIWVQELGNKGCQQNGLLERGMMFVTELKGWLTVDTWAGLGQTAGYFIFSGGAGGHHSNWKSK